MRRILMDMFKFWITRGMISAISSIDEMHKFVRCIAPRNLQLSMLDGVLSEETYEWMNEHREYVRTLSSTIPGNDSRHTSIATDSVATAISGSCETSMITDGAAMATPGMRETSTTDCVPTVISDTRETPTTVDAVANTADSGEEGFDTLFDVLRRWTWSLFNSTSRSWKTDDCLP